MLRRLAATTRTFHARTLPTASRSSPGRPWGGDANFPRGRAWLAVLAFALFLAFPGDAHASFLSPEAEDTLATIIALVVLFLVPVVLIVLFWLVHILPEQIAHKRHHPQFEAIRTLCLLSLVFGGLLWPLAWIWAYSKPVMHKLAYGTDKLAHGDEPDTDEAGEAGGLQNAWPGSRRAAYPMRT